jgi:hypothetical protein
MPALPVGQVEYAASSAEAGGGDHKPSSGGTAMNIIKKITAIDYHRNGIAGNGFYVATFTARHPGGNFMMAVVFPEPGNCAVFSVPELAKCNIQFAQGNSWRGDWYEPELRDAIDKLRESEGIQEKFTFELA